MQLATEKTIFHHARKTILINILVHIIYAVLERNRETTTCTTTDFIYEIMDNIGFNSNESD